MAYLPAIMLLVAGIFGFAPEPYRQGAWVLVGLAGLFMILPV